ncbi:Secreted protein [Phytophthora palmivora]|uniref:Secreted protein n=1 Tax=Phytophthora palmivora TaxID=4796 RepID=A0A2P4Y608_9STRA|nr:Secreted protein [Phytophthora palmivora]
MLWCQPSPQGHAITANAASAKSQFCTGPNQCVRKEQDAWRCLVLDMDLLEQWPEIVISPFGVVDKGNEDATSSGRTVNDLSFPEGSSINDYTDQDSITKPDYRHCDAVATEILRAKYNHPGAEIHVMADDVASAFRNVSIHSNSVYLFAGLIEEENALVIELSAPFGWTGSPGFYEIFGGAISHIHGSHTNTICPTGFFNYHWVYDHINVTANIGSSCREMDRSLRFAIVAILGADAINDKKFTAEKNSSDGASVITISSQRGSIVGNKFSGNYSYEASKAVHVVNSSLVAEG